MPSQQPKRLDPLNSVKSGAKAFGTAQSTRARRAVREMEKDKRGWIRHGVAAVAIAGLGLAAAGAVAITGHANETGVASSHVSVSSTKAAGLTGNPSSSRNGDTTSRSSDRQDLKGGSGDDGVQQGVGTPLDGTVDMSALREAQKNAKVTDTSTSNSDAAEAGKTRAEALKSDATRTQELSGKLSKEERAQKMEDAKNGVATSEDTSPDTSSTDTSSTGDDSGSVKSSGGAALPVAKGSYHIAATFGQYGSWSRWHTGVDFAAAIGTPIHAPGSGTITNAGYGPASSWAGNYVVVEFSNGDQMLMAHMSSVSVSKGQHVNVGQVIGHVGQTGRAFGPHTHVEFYPRGITPGDVYKATDPVKNYFSPHGLSV